MRSLRIIPTTITIALLFLGVKLVDVVRGSHALSEAMLISKVQAQQTEGEAPKPAETKAEEKPAEPKPAETAAPAEKKEEGAKKEADMPTPVSEPATKSEGEGEGKEKKTKPNPNVSEKPGDVTERRYTAVEVELLQNLSKRRDELDRWERNVQIKESMLEATEKRVADKIEQIEAMKKEVSELLMQYNAQEDAKIRSLVKIYESMKPKDAARIFDEIEMPILLLVIDKMAEKKAAPILAEMDSRKAKQITVDLAAQRSVNTAKLNTITAKPEKPATTQ